MLIVFSGLPGTGKSALADRLGRHLVIPVLSVDPIESAMLSAGLARSFETGLAAYMVVETVAAAQLGLGQSAIVDAVNSVDFAKQMWRRLADRFGTPLRVIECTCTDERLHRERLSARARGLALPEPTWEDVERRRSESTRWKEPLLTVDAAEPLDENLARVQAWLREG